MLDCLWGFLWGYSRKAALASSNLLKHMVSAAGLEPATHALKGLPEPRISDLHGFVGSWIP